VPPPRSITGGTATGLETGGADGGVGLRAGAGRAIDRVAALALVSLGLTVAAK
jgi:hypothetical protein